MFRNICVNKTFASLSYVFLVIWFLFISSKTSSIDAKQDISEDHNWNTVFKLRNEDDWRQLWHTEKHKRCYQDLIDHMDWVCDKDIYKLRSKRDLTEEEIFSGEPFLSSKEANMFGILRLKKSKSRRINKRGIIDECCNGAAGCSWEEYAEYCPANTRIRN